MTAIPETHYAGIGRVTVAATKVELAMSGISRMVLDLPEPKHVAADLGTPGQAMKQFVQAAEARADIPELHALVGDARLLAKERNKLVHALLVTISRDAELVMYDPRTGKDRPLPTANELATLERGFDSWTTRAFRVWGQLLREDAQSRAVADSVRTAEG